MSASDSTPRSTSLNQQRTVAKELVRAARRGDPDAIARIRVARADAGTSARPFVLADAQFSIAREAGFDSWPALVADTERTDVQAFCDAVRAGDATQIRRLVSFPHVRARVNDPLFEFGRRAAHIAARNTEVLTVLLQAGADVNLLSDWANGPYTVLDEADEASARFLIEQGATLTPNVAARLGWFDEVRNFVAQDPTMVHARGGDGQQPLHEARTVEIADYLLDHGAEIDARCIDHASTPAQYALVGRPDVCRRLLERGATPDIFMPARLGDLELATRLIDADPSCVSARINEPGYQAVPPFNTYCWSIGFGLSPHDVAQRFGHGDVYALLTARSPARVRFVQALLAADEEEARRVLAEDPNVLASMTRTDHGRLAQAIFWGHHRAAALMLRLGFDPAGPGVDGGSALHAACWVGSVALVDAILAHGGVPVDSRDPTHGSTPLGWAAFGSVHRRAPGADYPAVIDRLVAAGADITAPGNGEGLTLRQMAQSNPAVLAALDRHGV